MVWQEQNLSIFYYNTTSGTVKRSLELGCVFGNWRTSQNFLGHPTINTKLMAVHQGSF